MRLGSVLVFGFLLASTPAFGRIITGLVVGPGGSIGAVRLIPDVNTPIPGYTIGKALALSSVKSLLRPDWSKTLRGVKLYKFTSFPNPISDFDVSDRSMLQNCVPVPARFMSKDDERREEYYLVVLDCPKASNPKDQLAAVVKTANRKTLSIVINSTTVPVVDSNG